MSARRFKRRISSWFIGAITLVFPIGEPALPL
jgi:hypothetical protein